MEGNEHESKYLGVSADAIPYRMEKLGFSREEIPSVSTIKRIVKKHGLIVNKRERYPRRFCRFIRFCLYVGVEVVFINPTCPWMNGSIENFNGWFEAKFWDKERIKISR